MHLLSGWELGTRDLGKRALKLYREKKDTLSEIVIIMLGMGRLRAAVL